MLQKNMNHHKTSVIDALKKRNENLLSKLIRDDKIEIRMKKKKKKKFILC